MICVSANLDNTLVAQLDDAVQSLGRTRDDILSEAVRRYLEEMFEDAEDIADAQRISAAVSRGEMKLLSSDEMWSSVGL